MNDNFNDIQHLNRIVLIVDDEAVNREILGAMLEEEFTVIFAADGEEAMDIIEDSYRRLSCILLDLVMPGPDGFTVLKRLKSRNELKHIPVIVLTSEQEAEVKCLKLGAADFIKKPYSDPEVIRARVSRTIELSEDREYIRVVQKDELTGLYSRQFFYEYARTMDIYNKDGETDAVVLDVEHFHLINEMYGRGPADEVLFLVGGAIREFLETTEGIACRSDADIFLIYIRHQADYSELIKLIEKKVSAVLSSFHIRVRIGVYEKAMSNIVMEQRFSYARVASNTLRGKYGKDIAFYDPGMSERSIYQEHLISDIHGALKNNEFEVYYQPKFRITGDEPVLCSAEALVRWRHYEYGLIKPDEFLPVFEKNGLIRILDRYVWKKTIEQMREWRERAVFTLPVSVNVSRIDLYDEDMCEYLLDCLKENGLASEDIYLEITESAYTDDNDQLIKAINKLKAAGFKIEMDDFGSGYSSLNVITEMPIDFLKLDMNFIKRINEDEKVLHIVKLIIDMAKFMGVTMVAEGVEVEPQYEILRENGCEIVQGFYFSKPLPAMEFEICFAD
ncbi:MAG: EAL domain-containing protein [Lachnospiraceae bacterium]|nr:EAL domain-containing protein [Lachnospiraceae bacterium]